MRWTQFVAGHGKWLLSLVLVLAGAVTVYGITIELDDARPYGNIGTPAVTSSNLVDVGGILFETRFEPDEFTGDVVARDMSSDGDIDHDETDADGYVTTDNAKWRAHEQLPDWDERIIFTTDKQFLWSSLSQDLKDKLDPNGAQGDHGIKLVNWLRGKSNFEGSGANDFRSRTKEDHEGTEVHYPLGDFVHSALQYVGPPSRFYTDPAYDAFRVANKARVTAVFVGGNDGMLHAFKASNGIELFAYIPESVLDTLEHLSDQKYRQGYYVDGTPTIEDAFGDFPQCPSIEDAEDDCWRTILVGGLNSGGKSVYALDVTKPNPQNESDAADEMFLWEFTHDDLGHTFSRPVIAKLHDGRWVAIFGSGIQDAGEYDAALFIVSIEDGSLIQKISVESVSDNNGLLSPAAYDANYDGYVDFVYAGDTDGNLWKFNLQGVDEGGDFEAAVAYKDGSDDLPLARVTGLDSDSNVTNLVIQTAPVVTTDENGTILVVFGTGRVFGDDDAETDFGDGLFGILDNADPDSGHGVYPDDFTLNTFSLTTNDDGDVRTLDSGTDPDDPVGWRVSLDAGEKILTQLVLTSNRISFTSLNSIPENNQNWLNGVDYLTGGTPPQQFLDIDDDGDIDSSDLESGAIPVSLDLGFGIVSGPRVANIDGGFDVNIVTNALKRPSTFDSPFNDPGLIGGHFDLDTFDQINEKSCWDAKGCHTHEYDDDWDVTGVNMLVSGGEALDADAQGRKLANGILSSKHRGLKEAMQIEEDNPDKYDDNTNTKVYIRVINPYSVDTPALAQARADQGIDDNEVAPPATIFFQCWNGQSIELSAPLFNALAIGQRTCWVADINTLMINFSDINSLRATKPNCVKDNETGPILGDPDVGLNTAYRDGAIVVQVVRESDDVVIYENANYEHLSNKKLIKNNVPDDIVNKVECEQVNEDLRAYKDPEKFGGNPVVLPVNDDDVVDSGDGSGGSGGGDGEAEEGGGDAVETNPQGEVITKGTVVSATAVSSTRVSWRELLE